MRRFLRTYLLHLITLMAVVWINPGFSFDGSLQLFLAATLVFAFLNVFLRPLVNILLLPLNLLTLNLVSFLLHIIMLYILTLLFPSFLFRPFSFLGADVLGFSIPPIRVTQFLSVILTAVLLSVTARILRWIFK